MSRRLHASDRDRVQLPRLREEGQGGQVRRTLSHRVRWQETDVHFSVGRSTRFSTFPDLLLVNAARFQIDNWVPRKVDVPLVVPAENLDMSPYVGSGVQDGEHELPQDAAGAFRVRNLAAKSPFLG
ncbi:MAG: hypothetical protein LBE67_18335 [Kocuria palustris]|nr:hypothetical protein [Kocuria palustris]